MFEMIELHPLLFFPRQRILTQWIKIKSNTVFFQKACMSTIEPFFSPDYLNEATLYLLPTETTPLNSLYLCFRLPYFDVGPSNGTIYVKNHDLLDREVRSLFTATLQATDTSNKVGTTLLEITVTDINDNAPEFGRESYLQLVQEGKNFELQIQVTEREQWEKCQCLHLIDYYKPKSHRFYFNEYPNHNPNRQTPFAPEEFSSLTPS